MDVLFRADIFLNKFFQLNVHPKGNRAPEKKRKFFRIQASQIAVVEKLPKPFIVGAKIAGFLCEVLQKPGLHLFCGHGPPGLREAVGMIRHRPLMPEKHPRNLIRSCLHIEDHAHALAFSCICPRKLQHNGAGKILVAQIGEFLILPDIHHSPEILNQASVRVVRRRLIEKSPSVRVCVQHNLHGVNDRGFPAPGVAGEEIDPLMKGQDPVPDIVPVI